jgi:hypothetical protein
LFNRLFVALANHHIITSSHLFFVLQRREAFCLHKHKLFRTKRPLAAILLSLPILRFFFIFIAVEKIKTKRGLNLL